MSKLNENSCDTKQDALKEEQPSLEGKKNEKFSASIGNIEKSDACLISTTPDVCSQDVIEISKDDTSDATNTPLIPKLKAEDATKDKSSSGLAISEPAHKVTPQSLSETRDNESKGNMIFLITNSLFLSCHCRI